MISFRNLLPKRLRTTTWADIIESAESFLKTEVKDNYLDPKYYTYPKFLNATTADLITFLDEQGDTYNTFDGYTGTKEYFIRRLYTLMSRRQYRRLPLGYQDVLFIYALTGNVYPLLNMGSYLYAWEDYYTAPESYIVYVSLDTGWTLDSGLTLDNYEYFSQVTNHFIIEYTNVFIEDVNNFLISNSMLSFLRDIELQKKIVEVPHFECAVDVYANQTNLIGNPKLTAYTDYSHTLTANQSTYYSTGSLSSRVFTEKYNGGYIGTSVGNIYKYNNILYIISNNSTHFTAKGVGVSIDGGNTFTILNNGIHSSATLRTVFVDNTAIYVSSSTNGVYISYDNGSTFINKTTANGLGNNLCTGIISASGSIYVSTFGGVSISTNGGISFVNKTTANGLGSNIVWGIYATGTTVYAATSNGLSISIDSGATWVNKTTANGLGANGTYSVQSVGSNVYVATDGGVSISTNGGISFVNKTTANGLGGNGITSIYVENGIIYAGINGGTVTIPNGLSVSIDGGTSFTHRNSESIFHGTYGTAHIGQVGLYVNNNIVYIGTELGLYISQTVFTSAGILELTYNSTNLQTFNISTNFDVIENNIINEQQVFKIRQVITWDTKILSFNEITLKDNAGGVIVKATLPTINFNTKMLSSVRVNFYLD